MEFWSRSKAIIASFFCLLMFLVALALVSTPAAAHERRSHNHPREEFGTWSLTVESAAKPMQLSLHFGEDGRSNMSGMDVATNELSNRNFQAGETQPHAHFELARQAGTFFFDGVMNESAGAGKFTFKARPEYIGEMKALGYTVDKDDVIDCALFNVSTEYAKEIRAAGYQPDFDQLEEMRIFNVDKAHIAAVTKLQGKKPSIDDLVSAKIFKVTPEFATEAAQFGFGPLSMEDLTAFRIHGVDREFLEAMKQAGYSGFSAEKAVEMRIHGVSPEFIKELASLGYKNLSIDQLVEMRIFGVDGPYIRKQTANGKHPSVDQLVERKQFGEERADKRDKDDMI